MSRCLVKASRPVLLLALLLMRADWRTIAANQAVTPQTERGQQDAAKNRSKLFKTHFANGNQAMQHAQAIRQQLQRSTDPQNPTLLNLMKSDYQTAITEYQQSLQDAEVRDENALQVLGKIGVIRNGLVSQEKAVQMLVQDKDLPVILSNLGLAYSGVGEYQHAIAVLQQAVILKPAVGTYSELGTDLAQVGSMPEAAAACDKILAVDFTASGMQASCYKNIAIVLTNHGKLADAIAPLQKATQLAPQDASAWKLLGDALSSTVTSKSEGGKIVNVIPPGAIEAYQRYLQLDPTGPYAPQVQSALEGLAQLTKPASTPAQTKEKN